MNRRSLLHLTVGGAALLSRLGETAAWAAAPDIDALLEPIRKQHDLPALAGAIVTPAGAVAVGAVGHRKYGDATEVTHGDQFHLGSCTKAMTATLVGMLVDEGKLRWEMTLPEALPNLKETIHPRLQSVTLNHLLCHRSGISSDNWLPGKSFLDMHRLPGTPRQQREYYISQFLKDAPLSEPGSTFLYANRNFAVAGAIAERVTNTAWEDLMTERLFKPLGMTSAGFGSMGTPGKIDQPWQHRTEGDKRIPIAPGPYSDNPPIIGPGGTVHCTAADWAKFVARHLGAGRNPEPLVSARTLAHLHAPLFGGDYAFGWGTTRRDWGGGTVLSHSGSNNQNYAVVWMAPLKQFAVLGMTNQGGPGADKACDEVAAGLIGLHLKGG